MSKSAFYLPIGKIKDGKLYSNVLFERMGANLHGFVPFIKKGSKKFSNNLKKYLNRNFFQEEKKPAQEPTGTKKAETKKPGADVKKVEAKKAPAEESGESEEEEEDEESSDEEESDDEEEEESSEEEESEEEEDLAEAEKKRRRALERIAKVTNKTGVVRQLRQLRNKTGFVIFIGCCKLYEFYPKTSRGVCN